MKKIFWILPAILMQLIAGFGFYFGFWVPAPFLLLAISFSISVAMGGWRVAVLVSLTQSAFFFWAYSYEMSNAQVTQTLPQVIGMSVIFMLYGTVLGHATDRQRAKARSSNEIERSLRRSLDKETLEKNAQAALVAESEERLKNAVRIAGVGHFTFDLVTKNCTYCSDEHAQHFGLTPEEFCTLVKGGDLDIPFVHPEDRDVLKVVMENAHAGTTDPIEMRGVLPNGDIRYIRQIVELVSDADGNLIEVVGTSLDVTNLREAEARARQAQRIEAIGTLTGGIAHDFNNLMAVILGNLELCMENDLNDETRHFVQSSINATLLGADLTKNLLSFSRRAHLAPQRINLNKRAQKTMGWANRVLPETIEIETALFAGLWDVEVDPTSIENAIINILLNARDAMPKGGKVTIETANMTITDAHGEFHGEDITPGDYVMLAITDTGTGIPADKIEQVFDPFYTDKPVGQGSGLGLSMVQGFIKQSGGAIRVYSEMGVGTSLKLYFKAANKEQAAPKPTADARPHVPVADGHQRILLVEDEPEVMRAMKRTLDQVGYDVTTASSGDAGLAVFKADPYFDLLLTDVVMPGALQGPALAKAIRVIAPDLPCIFLSGYATEALAQGNDLAPNDISLMKPVPRVKILQAVSTALKVAEEL